MLGLITTWYSLHLGHRLPYIVPTNVTLHPADCTPEMAARVAQGRQPTGFWEKAKACTVKAARETHAWRSDMQLKDPSELLARFGGGGLFLRDGRSIGRQAPHFLRATDQYPACLEDVSSAAAASGVQCGPLPDDSRYNENV